MTQDHKPELESERKRIESLGGFVSYLGCWRAMGILAMSRAIGDLFLKPYVSPEPDVVSLPLDSTDEFLVLASDGVFDVFDNEQVVQIVASAASPEEAANLLTHSAFVAGSLDNITAVVVALRGYKPAGASAAITAPSRAEPRWWDRQTEAEAEMASSSSPVGDSPTGWLARWLDATAMDLATDPATDPAAARDRSRCHEPISRIELDLAAASPLSVLCG